MRTICIISLALLSGCWVTTKEVKAKLEPVNAATGTPGGTITGLPGGTAGGTVSGSTTGAGTAAGTLTGTVDLSCVDHDLGFAASDSVYAATTSLKGNDETPDCFGTVPGNAPDHVFSWTAATTGCYALNTLGSSFDTVLYVREGACDGTEIACNDNRSEADSSSEIGLDATANQTYIVVVDGHDGADSGDYVLNINSTNPIPVDRELYSYTGNYDSDNIGQDTDLMPTQCAYNSGSDVIHRWVAPGSKLWTFTISAASFDTSLSLFRQCTEDALACADVCLYAGCYGGEELQLYLNGGEEILIRVAGYQPGAIASEGTYTLSIQ